MSESSESTNEVIRAIREHQAQQQDAEQFDLICAHYGIGDEDGQLPVSHLADVVAAMWGCTRAQALAELPDYFFRALLFDVARATGLEQRFQRESMQDTTG